jgi:SPP1 family predicted phage head-tail adaptor
MGDRRTINIGRLKKRVTLFHLIDGEDSMGQSTQQLKEVAAVWSDIYPIRGSEFYELKKIQSKVTHKCFIRYHASYADIDSNWYLQLDGKIFDVDSAIDVDYQHKLIEVRCYERVNKEGHEMYVPPVTPDPEPTPQEPVEDPEEEEEDG